MRRFPYPFINATFNYYRDRNFLEVRKFSKVTLILFAEFVFSLVTRFIFSGSRTSLSLIFCGLCSSGSSSAFACGKSGENQHISKKKYGAKY